MTRYLLTLIALISVITGCTNKQVYTAVQQNRQFECQKLPQSQYEECMKDYDQSYEDYANDREAILKDQQ